MVIKCVPKSLDEMVELYHAGLLLWYDGEVWCYPKFTCPDVYDLPPAGDDDSLCHYLLED